MNPEVHLVVQFTSVQGIPKRAFFSAFTEWILSFKKCISVKGEYFEGLK